jgi:tetratricopeptide (TPR) repeat protein
MAYSYRGEAYLDMGNHNKAIVDFSEAIRLCADDPLDYVGRAKAYRALGDEGKAAEDERKAKLLRDEGS